MEQTHVQRTHTQAQVHTHTHSHTSVLSQCFLSHVLRGESSAQRSVTSQLQLISPLLSSPLLGSSPAPTPTTTTSLSTCQHLIFSTYG